MMIDEIISLCCKQDAKTWLFANKAIIKFIPAKKYTVIVPDPEIALFQDISNPQFTIQPESFYSEGFHAKIASHLPSHRHTHIRWYLQQFIKLEILNRLKENINAVLWDGDTVPLEFINFIDDDGKLRYFVGVENHHPYFETVKQLLDIDRQVSHSFISQSFPIKSQWFQEFKKTVEYRSGKPWFEAILNAINFSQNNAFSEYETLGNFIALNHPNEISFSHEPWLRLGNSEIGDVSLLNASISLNKLGSYKYVSFEKWDRARPYFLKVILPIFMQKKISPVLARILKWKFIRNVYIKFLFHNGILKIDSGVGLFSCCTNRLKEILIFFNSNHTTPKFVDSFEQFSRYKDNQEHDVSRDLFLTKNHVPIDWTGVPINITDTLDEEQFSNYKKINFKELKPFIDKYFSPSKLVTNSVNNLTVSSKFEPDKTCVIRFRGTDKEEETIQPSYKEILAKALSLKAINSDLQFAIQTDDAKFRKFIFNALGRDCFEVEKVSWNGWMGDKDYINFYASILLLSKSKYIITTSGNGELWMILFRGNTEGVMQYLQHKEIIYGKHNPSFLQGQTNFWIE